MTAWIDSNKIYVSDDFVCLVRTAVLIYDCFKY